MGPGIPLVLGALGLIAFVTSTKSASAAGKPTGPVRPEFQNIPLPLLQEMAKVVQALTVTDFDTNKDGSVKSATIAGPVTKEAVQAATSLAAKLEQADFDNAARTIRDLAKLAGKKIPTPIIDKQIPLPAVCFTAAESESLNRLVGVERDPKKLQAVLDALKAKKVPPECKAQVTVFLNMLSALITQAQAKIDDEEALRKTEAALKDKEDKADAGAKTGDKTAEPVPFKPGIPDPGPGPTPRVTIVQSGDGFARITKRLLGSDTRWRELRDRNVPMDADGRSRSKDSDSKGGIKPILQPNQKLYVPESWPAMDSKPVNPVTPDKPNPVNPVIPPQPDGVTPRVTIVQSGDGFARITKRLLGSDARWPELRDRNVPQDADGRTRAKDTAAKGGIKPVLQPNQKLFVPESWPLSTGGIPIPAPTPTPIPTPVPASTKRVYTVASGDGFSRIAMKLGVDQGRWPEIRDRNLPVDADGRSRSKDTAANGGIKPILNPGNRLFVPENWPASGLAVTIQGQYNLIGLSDETTQVLVEKTPIEMSAESLVSHLNRLQKKHPGSYLKVKSKCDKRIIARFQKLAGVPVTATVTPATLIEAAKNGQCELPLVLEWGDASSEHVNAYRMILVQLAKETADPRAKHELLESVKREKGQAAGLAV